MAAIICLLPRQVSAQAPPPAFTSPDDFSVRVDKFWYHSHRAFAYTSDFAFVSDLPGTVIHPTLSVTPARPLPILNSEPRLVLHEAIGANGEDLLSIGELEHDAPHTDGRTLFHFPRLDRGSEGFRTYGGKITTRNSRLNVPYIPAAIRTLKGHVAVEVVTKDEIRLIQFDGGAFSAMVEPWLQVSFEPSREKTPASLSYMLDASRTASRQPGFPIVNAIELRSGSTSVSPDFMEATEEAGVRSAKATLWSTSLQSYASLAVHIVHATQTVLVPFELHDIELTQCPYATNPLPKVKGSQRDYAATHDDYEARLLKILAKGEVTRGYGPEGQERGVTLVFGMRSRRPERRTGEVRFSITRMLDPNGQPVGSSHSEVKNNGLYAGLAVNFLPRPKHQVAGCLDLDRYARETRLWIPFDWLPPYLSVLAGHVDVAEVARDCIVEIPVEPLDQEREVCDGVTIITRAAQEPSTARVFEIRLKAGDNGANRLPMLNMVQPIDENGAALEPVESWRLVSAGPNAVVRISEPAAAGDGKHQRYGSLRLHVVQDVVVHRVPFEFHDLPITVQ